MEYVKIALLVIQLLEAMKEKEKGKGLTDDDITDIAATASILGILKPDDHNAIIDNISFFSELIRGISDLFDGEGK